jgi:hypothetical protein
MAIRPARLDPLALSASGHETVVNDRAAASGEKRMDLSEEIAWFGNTLNFGDILNMDGPLVEIGPRSVFGKSGSRWQAVASGGRSVPGLNPLAPTSWGVERGAESKRRTTFPGCQKVGASFGSACF